MEYTRIELPNQPATLPPYMDVRDYSLANGKYARVILEVMQSPTPDQFVVRAQAYEMTSTGLFVTAPNGYPSRTGATEHSTPISAVGDTVQLDDAWCRFVGIVDPVAEELEQVNERPTTPGTAFGQKKWDPVRQHAWIWTEGVACIAVRAKLQDLDAILNTSGVRSGLVFRSL